MYKYIDENTNNSVVIPYYKPTVIYQFSRRQTTKFHMEQYSRFAYISKAFEYIFLYTFHMYLNNIGIHKNKYPFRTTHFFFFYFIF